MDHSILRIYNYIQSDLERLEKSNLKFANPEKYNSFKAAYNELSQKLAMFERGKEFNIDANNSYSLLIEFATISANYEFYMLYQDGLKEVDNYQINKLKDFLNNLLKKLDPNNWQLIFEELNDSLEFYQKNDISALQNNEIISLINRVKYKILRISKQNLFSYTPEQFLPFIIEDIENICKNPDQNELLKQVLQKYLIDVKLIVANFQDVLALIELSNNPNVSEIDINNALSNHDESDYQPINDKDYNKLKDITNRYNITLKRNGNHRKIETTKCFRTIMQQPERAALINEFIIRSEYSDYGSYLTLEIGKNFIGIKVSDLIEIMKEENFTNFAYLIEGIIVNKDYEKIEAIIKIREQLAASSSQYSTIIDNLVIRFKNHLSIGFIAKYAKTFEIENLLSFIISDKRNFNVIKHSKEYRDLIQLLKKFNKPQYYHKIAEYLSFEEIYQLNLAEEYVLEKIQNHLDSLHNPKDKLRYLISIPLNDSYPKVIEFICENVPVENFLEFLDQSAEFGPTILEIYVSPEKKEKIENIIYQKIKAKDFSNKFLRKIIGEYVIANPFDHLNRDILNCYQVFYISSFELNTERNRFDDIEFFKKNITYKLDWNTIFQNFKNYEWDLESTLELLYSQNKKEFIKLYNSSIPDRFLEIFKKIAKEAIKENPEDSIYFIDLLTEEEILLLPKDVQDICCENIGEEFDFSDIDDITIDYKNIKKILLFMIHKGLFSEKFIVKNLDILKQYSKLLKALLNSAPQKYLISYYFFTYLPEEENNEMYILTNDDLQEIADNSETQEICDLKIRMYFEYAAKLINYLNYETAAKIVARIAELGIEDLIIEIKTNYPKYRDILLDNINNPELFAKVTQGEVLSTKDNLKLQLLRVKVEKNPQPK